jgi:hypothetical protein
MELKWNANPIPTQIGTFLWSADHAAFAHEGTFNTPSRRWTDAAIADFPPAPLLAQRFQQTQNIVTAFALMVADVDAAFKLSIQSPQWDWPRVTRRRNGTTVGSPRDIVDTGELLASQSYTLSEEFP